MAKKAVLGLTRLVPNFLGVTRVQGVDGLADLDLNHFGDVVSVAWLHLQMICVQDMLPTKPVCHFTGLVTRANTLFIDAK